MNAAAVILAALLLMWVLGATAAIAYLVGESVASARSRRQQVFEGDIGGVAQRMEAQIEDLRADARRARAGLVEQVRTALAALAEEAGRRRQEPSLHPTQAPGEATL